MTADEFLTPNAADADEDVAMQRPPALDPATSLADYAAATGPNPEPVGRTLRVLAERGFTGELTFQLDDCVRVYLDAGQPYMAERQSDDPLGRRLVARGALESTQLLRGAVQVGGSEHLARLFQRERSIDRDRVIAEVETLTDELLAEVMDREASVTITPYRHHRAGVHRWFVSPPASTSPLPSSAQRVPFAPPVAPAAERVPSPIDEAVEGGLRIEWDEPLGALPTWPTPEPTDVTDTHLGEIDIDAEIESFDADRADWSGAGFAPPQPAVHRSDDLDPPSVGELAPPVAEFAAPPVDELVAPEIEALAAPQVEELVAPEVDELAAPQVEELVAPEVEELAAPQVEELVAPEVDELAAPPVEELVAPEVDELAAPPVEELVAPEVEALAAPQVEELVAPEVEALAAPQVEELAAPSVDEVPAAPIEELETASLGAPFMIPVDELVADIEPFPAPIDGAVDAADASDTSDALDDEDFVIVWPDGSAHTAIDGAAPAPAAGSAQGELAVDAADVAPATPEPVAPEPAAPDAPVEPAAPEHAAVGFADRPIVEPLALDPRLADEPSVDAAVPEDVADAVRRALAAIERAALDPASTPTLGARNVELPPLSMPKLLPVTDVTSAARVSEQPATSVVAEPIESTADAPEVPTAADSHEPMAEAAPAVAAPATPHEPSAIVDDSPLDESVADPPAESVAMVGAEVGAEVGAFADGFAPPTNDMRAEAVYERAAQQRVDDRPEPGRASVVFVDEAEETTERTSALRRLIGSLRKPR